MTHVQNFSSMQFLNQVKYIFHKGPMISYCRWGRGRRGFEDAINFIPSPTRLFNVLMIFPASLAVNRQWICSDSPLCSVGDDWSLRSPWKLCDPLKSSNTDPSPSPSPSPQVINKNWSPVRNNVINLFCVTIGPGLTTSWQGLNTSDLMMLHILWAHGARCLFITQGFLGMTASGHDDSTLQLSPKSFAKVSGNICGVMKSSFLSPLKLPHSPHTRPEKQRCAMNMSRNAKDG